VTTSLRDADLDDAFRGANAYEILDGPPSEGGTARRHVLLARSSPDDLRSLREALRLGEVGGHCMCAGDATLRLLGAEGVLATIGLHHGTSIRWSDRWRFDARLASPDDLANLFAAQGWSRYRELLDEGARRAIDDVAAQERWLAAMPDPLRPLSAELTDDTGVPRADRLAAARTALLTSLGSEIAAVRTLLGWYGAGRGPWSGFPAYEAVAEHLLMTFSTATLVAALDGDLDARQLAGAARHLGSWHFRKQRKTLPTTLVDRLHAHLIAAGDADHLAQFEAAFKLRTKHRGER